MLVKSVLRERHSMSENSGCLRCCIISPVMFYLAIDGETKGLTDDGNGADFDASEREDWTPMCDAGAETGAIGARLGGQGDANLRDGHRHERRSCCCDRSKKTP